MESNKRVRRVRGEEQYTSKWDKFGSWQSSKKNTDQDKQKNAVQDKMKLRALELVSQLLQYAVKRKLAVSKDTNC